MRTPYFPGSLRNQMQKAVTAADVDWIIDNDILAIWPKGGYRSSQQVVPTISVDTGMIGYPMPSGQGLVVVKMLFNNQIIFGGTVNIESIISPAAGAWVVCYIEHDISALMPDGPWMTIIKGNRIGYGLLAGNQ